MAFGKKLVPKTVDDARRLWKEKGLRGVLSHYGWKVVAVAFVYYLVRDSLIYLVLPYLVARGLMPR